MNLFGLEIRRKSYLTSVPTTPSWWWSIRESFTGAWQRNITLESRENLLAFSAIFACVSLIADDISKMRMQLKQQLTPGGIWTDVPSGSPFWPVLRKPNAYQTSLQFYSLWMIYKLLYGNTYVLKKRDLRGIVTDLYVLDSRRVTPLVTEAGDVYYQLRDDYLNQVVREPERAIPASEIIHDRMLCLWHPLVGVSPITACAHSGTQGIRIQNNSAKFFENMSRPSGHLTAPGNITDETAQRLKRDFERDFSGENIGRMLVTGDGLKYEPFTIPANDAQLIEQLRWTVEDVARCFKVPLYKLGLAAPPASSIPALSQEYYSQTLQVYIESIEGLLDEGLELVGGPVPYGTEFDLEALLRMDPLSRAERNKSAISAGYMQPNEARFLEDRPPVTGGDSCYLQQQNFSLEALAKRDAQQNPFSAPSAPQQQQLPLATPADTEDQQAAFADALIEKFVTAQALELAHG